jgi:hypothetical protein
VEAVSQLAVKSTGPHLTDLLDILERILKRIVGEAAAQSAADSAVVLYTRQDFLPCREAVAGMVRVFRKTVLWNRNRNRNFLPCGTGTGTVTR